MNSTTRNPDSGTLVCIKLIDNKEFKDDAYITGLKPNLEANGDLHLTYKKSDDDLYYFIFDWTTGNDKKTD